ncbi:hypothetical protein M422DRAFT_178925, partial [Sphaerobolus stellatus SS14]
IGSDIYVGCSNGALLRYFCVDALNSSEPESYQLLMSQSLPFERPIDQIILVPSVEHVLVFSGQQIHFFSYPNLEPIEDIKPLRNVVSFALDEAQLRKSPSERRSPQQEFIRLCAIKRNSINVYVLTAPRLQFRKEIQFPNGGTNPRLINQHLCLSDQANYNIVDIETQMATPILPLSQASDSLKVDPSITIISDNEFLILSWTGTGSMGIFISGNGDPMPGRPLMQWPSHPVSVCTYTVSSRNAFLNLILILL